MKITSSTKRKLAFVVLSGLLALHFQNCGQPGAIEVTANSDAGTLDTGGDGDGRPTPNPTPTPLPPVAPTYKSMIKNFNVNDGTGKVDVLVVVDNSGSMGYEQKNMADRFDTFIDSLSGLDWQIGITTTDPRSSYTKDGKKYDVAWGDGQLSPFSTDKYLLKSSDQLAQAKQLFSSTIQRSEEGSGLEQGINATYRAIERAISADSSTAYIKNKGLIRSGAALAVIVVTDDDETAAKNASGDQAHGDRSLFNYRNYPENLNSFLQSQFPTKKIKFNSIVVKPNDQNCLANKSAYVNSLGENKTNSNEFYGHQYKIITDLTGGILGDVCAADYGEQLKIIGQAAADQVKEVLLECAPVDQNADGKVDVSVRDVTQDAEIMNYTVSGNKVVFDAYLPVSSYRISYTCYN